MIRRSAQVVVLLVAATVGIWNVSCKKDESNPPGPVGGTGSAVLKGIVRDAGTDGSPGVSGATVTLSSGGSVATNAGGEFTINVPGGTPVMVNVTRSGYSLNEMTVTVADGETKTLNVGLLQVGSTQNVSVASGGSVAQGGYTLQLPPGFVAPPGGSGTVSVSVTGLDPSTGQVRALPGGLEAIDANGATRYLQPVSFAEYTVKDANGNTLQFNQSASQGADIELPIPEAMRGQPGFGNGDPIECYLYDAESGKWKTPVPGIIGPSSVDGSPVIKATIFHLSWYGGAPALNDRGRIRGFVRNSDGGPAPNVDVEAFVGSTTTTDAQGFYQVDAAPNSNVRVVATQLSGQTIRTGEVTVFTGGTDSAKTAPDITLGGSQQAQFDVNAYLYRFSDGVSGFDFASVSIQLESTSSTWDSATVKLIQGNDIFTLPPAGSGIYQAFTPEIALVPGAIYALTIDFDRNGTIDASGQVRMVGGTLITSPENGSTVGRQFTATWNDSASGLPGYSATYYLVLSGQDSRYFLTKSLSKEIGDGIVDSTFYGYPQPNDPLPAGDYTMSLWGLNGPADFLFVTTPLPNISGQNVTGYFYSYSFGSEVQFTSTGQGASQSVARASQPPRSIREMIARMPEKMRRRVERAMQ